MSKNGKFANAQYVIAHALRFTAEGVRETYVYPARHSDGRSSSRTAPPFTPQRMPMA